MNNITQEQIREKKQSDTIVIYGCSWSINDLSDEEKEKLSLFDSIGFNYFCKSKIPTTFYILREQSIRDSGYTDERKRDFVHDLNRYNRKTTLLCTDMINSGHIWKGKRGWINDVGVFRNDGIVLKEFYFEDDYWKKFPKTGTPRGGLKVTPHKMDTFCDDMYSKNAFKNVLYFSCTISNAIHFAVSMGYTRILFVGVDLYDHRYFWLPQDVLREQTKRKGRGIDTKHKTCKFTTNCVKHLNERDVDLYVYNKKSLLAEHIKVWEW
jgi:hypothetical protein